MMGKNDFSKRQYHFKKKLNTFKYQRNIHGIGSFCDFFIMKCNAKWSHKYTNKELILGPLKEVNLIEDKLRLVFYLRLKLVFIFQENTGKKEN